MAEGCESIVELADEVERIRVKAEGDPYRNVQNRDMVPVFKLLVRLANLWGEDPAVREPVEAVEKPELDPDS